MTEKWERYLKLKDILQIVKYSNISKKFQTTATEILFQKFQFYLNEFV